MTPSSIISYLIALFSSISIVDATLTIAAADRTTGQIGATGTSCVPASLYNAVYQGVPGHGLLLTQAMPPPNPKTDSSVSTASPVYALADTLLLNGTDPKLIINAITDPNVDNEKFVIIPYIIEYDSVNLRQYGCVDLEMRSAGYTGKDLAKLYDLFGYNEAHVQQDIQGQYGDNMVYSAQGNIVSNTTVTLLSETFSSVDACDMVERLYLSIAAVFEAEGDMIGDIRCFDSIHASGSTVFIHVDNSDGSEVIHIENDSPEKHVNPWPEFKTKYQQWRQKHPCAGSDTKFSSFILNE